MKISLISFFRGMGSVLDIWPATAIYLPERSAKEVLAKDWEKVLGDFRAASETVHDENLKKSGEN